MKKIKNTAKMNGIHFATLVQRSFTQILSSPLSFLSLLLQAPAMLLIIYLVSPGYNFMDLPTIAEGHTTLFVIIFVAALMGMLNSYREITKEQDILKREVAVGLDPIGYVASKLFVMAVICLVHTIIIVGGCLLMLNFKLEENGINKVVQFFTVEFLTMFASSAIGLFISAIVERGENAILPVLFIIICQVVFAGALIPLSGVLDILSLVCPTRWGMTVLGNMMGINATGIIRIELYENSILVSFIALGAMIAILYTLIIAVIKKKTKIKQ